jgi:hydroxymethylbilane synthase
MPDNSASKVHQYFKNHLQTMASSTIRIVTRESPLAMWQAGFVRDSLCALHPGIKVEILGITTQADRLLDSSLESLGGKGAFVKELEQALLEGQAEIAVHSMKDVTIDLPANLIVPVVLKREDPRDVFVSNHFSRFIDLPLAARVGTSSLRRGCQLKAMRPDLQIMDIRGNVGTRLLKLDEDQFDALILAAAGIKRLGFEARVSEYFAIEDMIPAVSQGALGIEIHAENAKVRDLVEPLSHTQTQLCVNAERALNRRLGGDCHLPIAALAEIEGENINMRALVGRADGSEIVQCTGNALVKDAQALGDKLGQDLLDKGAASILQELKQ